MGKDFLNVRLLKDGHYKDVVMKIKNAANLTRQCKDIRGSGNEVGSVMMEMEGETRRYDDVLADVSYRPHRYMEN